MRRKISDRMKSFIMILLFLGLLLSSGRKEDAPSRAERGVILLSFDGYGPSKPWRTNYFYPSGLSDSAKKVVRKTVEKYYSLWKVVVTTSEDLFYHYPENKRVRCVITSNPLIMGGEVFKGISQYNCLYLGDTSCVLVSTFTEHNLQMLSVIATHEIAHSVGVAHQSVYEGIKKVDEYNRGTHFECPMMGGDPEGRQSVWYVGTNNFGQEQDDIEIISKTWKRK